MCISSGVGLFLNECLDRAAIKDDFTGSVSGASTARVRGGTGPTSCHRYSNFTFYLFSTVNLSAAQSFYFDKYLKHSLNTRAHLIYLFSYLRD